MVQKEKLSFITNISQNKHFFLSLKLQVFSYSLILSCVFGAGKSHLIKTVVLITYNICFKWFRNKKTIFIYTLLSRVLHLTQMLTGLQINECT